MDTMKLWDSVCQTDPKYTKKVNQRGGFTAIAAQSQIMEATRVFGPVGIGWGYECGPAQVVGSMIMLPVTIWHGSRENSFGPIYGCADMLGSRPDHDAPKKAMTDALTKGLSHLGFNADVFLGLFDDNKYVEERAAAVADANDPLIDDAQFAELATLIEHTAADIQKLCTFYKVASLKDLRSSSFAHARAALANRLPKGMAA